MTSEMVGKHWPINVCAHSSNSTIRRAECCNDVNTMRLELGKVTCLALTTTVLS